ncbi:MAG: hypothetical protein E6J69_11085, partial [Deltaproteobacteria bacterium]
MSRKAPPLLDRMVLACKPLGTAARGWTSGGNLMRFGTTPAPARLRRLAPAAALLGLLTVCSPPDAAAAIALVRNLGATGSGATGTTIAVTVPAGGVPAGHTVIVTVALDPAAGAVSCSDSKGNTYTKDLDVTRGSGTDGVRTVVCSAAIRTALAAGNTVVATHPSVIARAVNAAEFSGFLTPALDRSASATGATTTLSSGATAVTTQAAELLIGAAGIESKHPTDFTPAPGYTSLGYASSETIPNGLAKQVTLYTQYRVVSTIGSYSANGTVQPSRQWAAAIATYKENCGNGVVDPGEQCDGGACCNASCTFVASGTVCRTSGGACDVPEVCTGSSATCPADAKLAAGTICRATAGPCDVAETCDGTSNDCPADGFAAATTVCRAAAGECDVAETCTGNGPECPADTCKASSTTCADDGNPCTADVCDGDSMKCQHPAGNAGAVCRASAGVCDPAETCTGT